MNSVICTDRAYRLFQRVYAEWTINGKGFFTDYDISSTDVIATSLDNGSKVLALQHEHNEDYIPLILTFENDKSLKYLSDLVAKSAEIFGAGYEGRFSEYVTRNPQGEKSSYRLIDVGDLLCLSHEDYSEYDDADSYIEDTFCGDEIDTGFVIPEQLRRYFDAAAGRFSLSALSVMYCPSIGEHYDMTARAWVPSKKCPPNQVLVIAQTGQVMQPNLSEIRLAIDDADSLRRLTDFICSMRAV